MADDAGEQTETTRRAMIKYGTTVAVSGILAGCAGSSDSEETPTETSDDQTPTDAEPTATPTDTPEDTGTDTPEDTSYSVTMEPVGTVEFDSVPESIAPFTADYIDMLVALGHADAVESIWYRGRYKTIHYEELDGVSIDLDELTQLWNDGIPKEQFYEMDADLHLLDPNAVTDWLDNWKESDVDEIRTNVAPFLGNLIFRRTDDWHDYRYYSLYEAFEKVAQTVQEEERFEAIKSVHDDLVTEVQSRLPPEAERPNAALLFAGEEPEEFTPYRIDGNGANKEHFQTLGISDAFAGTGIEGYSGSQSLDYEALLEIDPDSLLLRYHRQGKTREEFENSVVSYLKDDEIGSQLTAVQNDRVFRGGPIYTGPLHNLFMIERYAKGYFPEEFTEEQLFDRQHLSAIITGTS
ncbi:ABC transporter substrate-binding protein [Halovenus marina]|uniref:ABC transporter substrate-binding protein n=1 Tax=Halovenus marina TaxID=3396621 RepID=UPI003F564474